MVTHIVLIGTLLFKMRGVLLFQAAGYCRVLVPQVQTIGLTLLLKNIS